MNIKDVNLTSKEIKALINKYNKEYDKNILLKNTLVRAVKSSSNKSLETLI